MNQPTLENWLAMPTSELAAWVREYHVSIKIALDGTRRHYLLKHPTISGEVPNDDVYAAHMVESTVTLLGHLYGHGIEAVLVLNMWPPDVQRRPAYLAASMSWAHRYLTSSPITDVYQRWNLKVRLYGDYDIAPQLLPIREQLMQIDEQLAATTHGENLLLWGYCGGDAVTEMITRTLHLSEKLGRPPTLEELRSACYPHGPERLSMYVLPGWLRAEPDDLSPVLNKGTDIYCLAHLPLDLSEDELRRMLYDHLFLRNAMTATVNLAYGEDQLGSLREFYTEHQNCFIGFGKLVGPNLWYPDHIHADSH